MGHPRHVTQQVVQKGHNTTQRTHIQHM